MLSKEVLHRRKIPRDTDIRGDFFRDTTAILHSYPFRRLKNKTQVFFAPQNDHICTRIEHAFHVSTIAAAVCKGLDLDGDLAWAIGLGHDLGHAPFGHTGEKVLSEICGSFIHELFSLRVVDMLALYGEGLNLTYAVRDGIAGHCGEKFEQRITPRSYEADLNALSDRELYPCTWEGVTVRFADKAAYLGRDIEDAVQLGVISRSDLPKGPSKILGSTNREIINTLVNNMIESSMGAESIGFSDRVYEAVLELKEFNYQKIYLSPLLTSYHDYFHRVLDLLVHYLRELFCRWGYDTGQYRSEKNLLAGRFGDYLRKMQKAYEETQADELVIAVDYVAGMTDTYALECVQEILTPRHMHEQFNRMILEYRDL